ncbi:MAG: hypothetical protein FIB07_17945 [Candidatus Methanoperedens sp.]|nr:hypothetical protein [Candidatus Methanoperedens sp.]
MVSRIKIVTTVIMLLILSVILSGCNGEKNNTREPDSTQTETVAISSQTLTNSSNNENMPEIKITSFSSIYLNDNNENIYLFSWENVPGNESHRLLNYLKNNRHLDWVENAKITKDVENKTIHIFTDNNSIEIIRYNETSYLKIGDVYDLLVRQENGRYNVYDVKYGNKYNISERCYAVYDISIKNNGSSPIFFKLDGLRLHEGDRMFKTESLEPFNSRSIEVLYDNEIETKLQDTTLLPGQTVNGTVTFHVNSLYNESFLLVYNTTPVTSTSFGKSFEALWKAEHFNYQVVLGMPPYADCKRRGQRSGSFDIICDTWANWLNRSIFETFQKSDLERMQKSPPDNIPSISMVYALRVIPGRNITMYPVATTSNLVVIDDTGEEIINTSRIEEMAVMSNMTFISGSGSKLNFPGMNLSNASIVRISFLGRFYNSGRVSINNQDVILDDKLNIIVVRNYPLHYII